MGEVDLTERIRQRAYTIWESEGRPHGLDQVHWLRAEAEISGAVQPGPWRFTASRWAGGACSCKA